MRQTRRMSFVRSLGLGLRNYRLQSTSPAIDVAPPASVNPDHDVEGTARPQGAMADLGAYEFHP